MKINKENIQELRKAIEKILNINEKDKDIILLLRFKIDSGFLSIKVGS